MLLKLTGTIVVFAFLTIYHASCAVGSKKSKREVTINIPRQFIPVGSKYYFVGGVEKLTWTEAHRKCGQLHAELAACESSEERAAISKALYHKENYGKSYWLSRNGRDSDFCPYCHMGTGWYYNNKACGLSAYWICQTANPMDVAQRAWVGDGF